MLRPFFPELVISTDLLRFENPSVLLFCLTHFLKSVLKWCIHLVRSIFSFFKPLGECHCWWTRESQKAYIAKFYGQLQLIRSILGHQNFPRLKLIEIVILWVYYTTPLSFSLFSHFWDIAFQLFILLFCLKITDEGSVPEMRILFVLLTKSF